MTSDRPLSVALIGNMNNNHFALMRYLRDLGFDAQLFLYKDETEHFRPECDTWMWWRWSPYVTTLSVTNGGLDALLYSGKRLRAELGRFDYAIGNGIAPVLFRKMGVTLDLMIPYGEGIEFIIDYNFRWRKLAGSVFRYWRKRKMEWAIKSNVHKVITANRNVYSEATYIRLGIQPERIAIPMLYCEQVPPCESLSAGVRVGVERMRSASLVVFSHVSLFWKNLPFSGYMNGGKKNDILIKGFAEYVQNSGNKGALLCLFAYGADVEATKDLVNELKIETQVHWFPKLWRREILYLLEWADIGGGEFAGMYWGGCGWEFLANGVPMLHRLDDAAAYVGVGHSLPPFFNVKTAHEIAAVLGSTSCQELREIGATCRRWFMENQGKVLACRYAEMIKETVSEKGKRAVKVARGTDTCAAKSTFVSSRE